MKMVHVFSRTPVLFLLFILGPARILVKGQNLRHESTLTLTDMMGKPEEADSRISMLDSGVSMLDSGVGVEKVRDQTTLKVRRTLFIISPAPSDPIGIWASRSSKCSFLILRKWKLLCWMSSSFSDLRAMQQHFYDKPTQLPITIQHLCFPNNISNLD
jgi:hypothetical protein